MISTVARYTENCKSLSTGLLAQYPQHKYLVAQVDYMNKELRGIKYSPTFAVFKQGRKIDQFYGAEPQQLQDHIWLHSDE